MASPWAPGGLCCVLCVLIFLLRAHAAKTIYGRGLWAFPSPVLLIYLGDGWLRLPRHHGNQNPSGVLTCTTVTPLGCLFILKLSVGGF